MKTKRGSLVFVVQNGRVLLAKKTRALGIGLWNGYGGNFDEELDVDFADCAVREFAEECPGAKISKDNLEYRGCITFHNGDVFTFKVHIFITNRIMGEPQPSIEMTEPTWFPLGELPPKEEFMESDYLWIPLILSGKKIQGDVWFDGNFKMTDKGVEIREV